MAGISFDRLAPRPMGPDVPVGGVAVSPYCGSWKSPTPRVATLVSNLTARLGTRGGAVQVQLATSATSNIHTLRSGGSAFAIAELYRNGEKVGQTVQVDRSE